MWPVPKMPIFMMVSPMISLKVSLACRVGEPFERAAQVVRALVGELAGRLDPAGDAPDLGFKSAAPGGQVDQHAALVSRIAGARDEARALQPLDQRRDRARVHAEAGAKGADGQGRAI